VASNVDWLIAPDSFKGTYSAGAVALAIARGVEGAGSFDVCPLADGGEGTLEILVDELGGASIDAPAHDPLGRAITTQLGWIEDTSTAIVEMSRASGLSLLGAAERDAEAASTFGTGELLMAAVCAGATGVVLAAGGSASTDGGAGAIQAIEEGGGLRGARLMVLADVTTPFERAAEVFGPQKGADEGAVTRLTRRLHRLAETLPRDPRGLPLSGAGGGLAGGLWARYGATLVPGAAWVLDAIDFDERLAGAGAVITGEGRLDAQTPEGKLLSELLRRCAPAGVPVHALVGSCTLPPGELASLQLASIAEAGDLPGLERAARSLASSVLST
jgi:glycerate 2-kinase